jgi:hypothetical protein
LIGIPSGLIGKALETNLKLQVRVLPREQTLKIKNMYIDIPKPAVKFIVVLIEKRMTVIKNRLIKEHKDDWYDYEGSQIHSKICDISPEFMRLNSALKELLNAEK